MIVGPNPRLAPQEADRIGRLLYRRLRDAAGYDFAHLVRPAGGGRVRLPADVFVEATRSIDEPDLEHEDALVLVSIDAEERAVLSAAWDEPTLAPEPTSGEPTSGEQTPPPALAVDPADKAAFPRIDDLVAHAEAHSIDLAGATKRADIEAAIARHYQTTIPS